MSYIHTSAYITKVKYCCTGYGVLSKDLAVERAHHKRILLAVRGNGYIRRAEASREHPNLLSSLFRTDRLQAIPKIDR